MPACAEKYDQVYQYEQCQRYEAIRREGYYIQIHVLLALQELIDGDACHGCRWKHRQCKEAQLSRTKTQAHGPE